MYICLNVCTYVRMYSAGRRSSSGSGGSGSRRRSRSGSSPSATSPGSSRAASSEPRTQSTATTASYTARHAQASKRARTRKQERTQRAVLTRHAHARIHARTHARPPICLQRFLSNFCQISSRYVATGETWAMSTRMIRHDRQPMRDITQKRAHTHTRAGTLVFRQVVLPLWPHLPPPPGRDHGPLLRQPRRPHRWPRRRLGCKNELVYAHART